ncbi:MAG: ketoacyl-ACP synthase III [bacterium]|nr:ketoacyl-ACP synthase III [bacterium]
MTTDTSHHSGSGHTAKIQGGVGIVAVGSYVPEKILTNHDLEKMVETSDEWITTRTGIKERRIAAPDQTTSDIAVIAAQRALEKAKMTAAEIELIIVATITGDVLFPATACYVQQKLGAKHAFAFDISAACTGFIYALSIAKRFIITGMVKNALVIGAEELSRFTDWTDRNTCVIFGDGAGAVILKPVPDGKGILTEYLGSDGSAADLIFIPAGGAKTPISAEQLEQRQQFIKMKGNEVFKFAVLAMGKSIKHALADAQIHSDQVSLMIPHQANIRIIQSSAERFNIPMEKVYVNIDKYGNTSAASIPIALDEAVQSGRIKENDIIVLVAFGAGLTWGSCVIRW